MEVEKQTKVLCALQLQVTKDLPRRMYAQM
jgi:hypothetical protein